MREPAHHRGAGVPRAAVAGRDRDASDAHHGGQPGVDGRVDRVPGDAVELCAILVRRRRGDYAAPHELHRRLRRLPGRAAGLQPGRPRHRRCHVRRRRGRRLGPLLAAPRAELLGERHCDDPDGGSAVRGEQDIRYWHGDAGWGEFWLLWDRGEMAMDCPG